MRIMGLLLLVAAAGLWLPMLFSMVSPLWWHDWFGNPETQPIPSQAADWIATSSQLATLGTGVGGGGIILLILGTNSKRRHSVNEP